MNEVRFDVYSGCALRPRGNGIEGQRRTTVHSPNRSGSSLSSKSHNPSARPYHVDIGGGRKQKGMEGPLTERNFCRYRARGYCKKRTATALERPLELCCKRFPHTNRRSTGPRSLSAEITSLSHNRPPQQMLQRGRAVKRGLRIQSLITVKSQRSFDVEVSKEPFDFLGVRPRLPVNVGNRRSINQLFAQPHESLREAVDSYRGGT